MKKAGFIILFLLLSITAGATAACPYPVTVRQPDGTTLLIHIHGDEFCHWVTDSRGYPIAQGSDGYWRSAPSLSPVQISALRRYNLSRMLPTDIHPPLVTKAEDLSVTDIRILVIPVQFSDTVFQKDNYREYLSRKLNTPGFSEDGACGSAKDYFESNFTGYTFTFEVTEVVTLPQTASYYGSNDESVPSRIIYDARMPQLVEESCRILDPSIDFSRYDQDGDGKLDHLIFVYAGYNEAEGADPDAIWSHEWDLSSEKLKFDRTQIGLYAAAAELRGATGTDPAGIGTFCHELSHTFGLRDLYDVNYGSDGLSSCLWKFLSIMDYGNFNNDGHTPPYYCAIDRETAGTAHVQYLKEGAEIHLQPIHESGTFYRLDTDKEGEYYLFEGREETGWDMCIGGHGMVIYHIDRSDRYVSGIRASVRWSENLINAVSGHECADLVEALPEATSIRQVFFPGQGAVTEFGPTTIPALETWDGTSLMLRISDIGYDREKITFNVVKDSSERFLSVIDLKVMPLQTEADLRWNSEKGNARWGIRWRSLSGHESEYHRDEIQKMEYNITGLEPNTEYQAEVFHIGRTGCGDTTSTIFSTRGLTSIYPRIIPARNYYQVGETLTMKVQNVQEPVKSLVWYINDLLVESDSVVLEERGELVLKAVITYASDGSSETITNTLIVK